MQEPPQQQPMPEKTAEPRVVYDTSTMYEKLSSAKLSMEEGLITAEEYDEYKERLLGRK